MSKKKLQTIALLLVSIVGSIGLISSLIIYGE